MRYSKLLLSAAISFASVCLGVQQADAGTLSSSGWDYTFGNPSNASGGSDYSIDAIAMKDTGSQILVALNGGMPLSGVSDDNYWTNNSPINIGYGDLFFNFTGQSFQTASQDNELYAVRFATDAANPLPVGVYSGVSAKTDTLSHDGYSSLKWYFQEGFGTNGDFTSEQNEYSYLYGQSVAANPTGVAWSSDTSSAATNTPILNTISSGTYVGGITALTTSNLISAGLDFTNWNNNATGSNTIAFAIDKSSLGVGNYMANIFMQCGNDGIGLQGNVQAVPEPNTVAGIVVGALLMGTLGLKRRRTVA